MVFTGSGWSIPRICYAAASVMHFLISSALVESFSPLHHQITPRLSSVPHVFSPKKGDANGDDDDKKEDKRRIRDILLNGEEEVTKAASEVFNGDMEAVDLFKLLDGEKSEKNGKSASTLFRKEVEISKEDETKKKGNPVSFSCRIVTLSDGKVPTKRSLLPESLFRPPYLMDKLDAIYHATAHAQTRSLPFMEDSGPESSDNPQPLKTGGEQEEEAKMISILRHSLHDAGFQLLTRRDLDLVQALNADYLLRLSIMADVSALDASISQDFFPERFELQEDGTAVAKDAIYNEENFLYEGRVLIFWRGYGSEVSRGRLLLPKIDYLQASIVQRAASGIRERLNVVEEVVLDKATTVYDMVSTITLSFAAKVLEKIPSRRVSEWAAATLEDISEKSKQKFEAEKKKNAKLFKLERYGGYRRSFTASPNLADALTPFTICEVDYGNKNRPVNGNATTENMSLLDSATVNHDIYEAMNLGHFSCPYDSEMTEAMGRDADEIPPMQLLERVSISNLVDFSPTGRKNLLKTIFAKNKLVEPTYQEVVVVWRPLPPKPGLKPVIKPPKFLYDLADMFDIEGLPELPKPEDFDKIQHQSLEIRAFSGVPMANLPAVLPKTKLIFRPADALVFDLTAITSLLLVIGSQRFDNPRLDLLALASFTFWVFRTVIRYSNKLARYDLLVKKFLTSKITHRNSGALKYAATEAGQYRATRAALVYTWLTSPNRTVTSRSCNDRDQLIHNGLLGVNELIREDKHVSVDIEAALQDLEELELIHFSADGNRLESVVRNRSSVVEALGNTWAGVFDERKQPLGTPRDTPRP